MTKEILKQALEALETCREDEWHSEDDFGMEQTYDEDKVAKALTALRTTLKQPRQEPKPVACRFCHSKKGCYTWLCDSCGEIDDVQQPAAQPEQQAEQIGWAVQGCSKMWRGEFAEIDAKAEAKRIGGTCVAFALYTEPPKMTWPFPTELPPALPSKPIPFNPQNYEDAPW